MAFGIASAQQTATVSGEVLDDSGLVIPGATVTATDAATGDEVTASTDSAGAYQLSLEPGTYTLSAESPGFEIDLSDPVQLAAGQAVERSFQLQLAVVTETIVVVGSRAAPRSVTESTVPVDVISTADLARQGNRDLVNQLRTVVPSFNINTQPISDAATVVRPANLRNLAPDHTLVLVNGKRRHRAAVITWLGNGIADGSQGPDISVIPSIAIRQVEVLRDGAAGPVWLGRHRRGHELPAEGRFLGGEFRNPDGRLPGCQSRGPVDLRRGHHRRHQAFL